MIRQAILNKQNLGHKVNPLNDGRVFVSGEMAVKVARKLEAEGLIEFISRYQPARGNEPAVFYGICIIK